MHWNTTFCNTQYATGHWIHPQPSVLHLHHQLWFTLPSTPISEVTQHRQTKVTAESEEEMYGN